MDVTTLRQLIGETGQRLLRDAETILEDTDPLQAGSRLRRQHPPDLVAAALTQVDLRRKARDKFGADAARMYFTRDGLEQATHALVAAHRAARLSHVREGVSVADLGCGVGADLAAFSRAGYGVTGVERDPLTAVLAETNLAVLGLPGTVRVGDAVEWATGDTDVVFVDPARRGGSGRVFRPEEYNPPWWFVTQLLARGQGLAAAKLAPGIDHARIPDDVEAEWVSLDGQLKEATLWAGTGTAAQRRATLLTTDGHTHTLTDTASAEEAVGAVGGYLYEPDDAVTRAHLVTQLAALVQGWRIDPHIALVAAGTPRRVPYARCFEVVDVLPYREKQLRAALRARNVGTLTVKPRGVDVVPERMVGRLGLRGDDEATIIVTRTIDGAVSFLVRPLTT